MMVKPSLNGAFFERGWEMEMDYTSFIDAEMLVLVPVLYIIGLMIKNTEKVANKYIPILLGLIGLISGVAWSMAGAGGTVNVVVVANGVIQGILCAGAAVFANQLFKQAKE
jgi:hypothetical protein